MLENIYVTIGIVAVLMILDYVLTLQGFKSYKQKYATFVQFESYELNPAFKASVTKNKYDLKHFLSVVAVAVLLYAFHYLSFQRFFGFIPSTFYLLQGMIVSMFICLNATHIQNVMIFNAVNKDPSLLSGKLTQSGLFSLTATRAQFFSLFLIFITLFLFSPDMFILGFALGPLIIFLKTYFWVKRS